MFLRENERTILRSGVGSVQRGDIGRRNAARRIRPLIAGAVTDAARLRC